MCSYWIQPDRWNVVYFRGGGDRGRGSPLFLFKKKNIFIHFRKEGSYRDINHESHLLAAFYTPPPPLGIKSPILAGTLNYFILFSPPLLGSHVKPREVWNFNQAALLFRKKIKKKREKGNAKWVVHKINQGAGIFDSFVPVPFHVSAAHPAACLCIFSEAELELISLSAPGKMGDNAILKTFSKRLSAQMWFAQKCLHLHLLEI